MLQERSFPSVTWVQKICHLPIDVILVFKQKKYFKSKINNPKCYVKWYKIRLQTLTGKSSIMLLHVNCFIKLQIFMAQILKNLPAMQEFSLWVGKIPLEKGMATHSSILAWRIPWTEEPGRLEPMGSQRVGHELHVREPELLRILLWRHHLTSSPHQEDI